MPGEYIRNDTMFRADGQSHANSAGLIGGSRCATDVGFHSDSPLLKQPFRYVAPVLIPLAPIP
jgi:hypothetical protein